MIVNDKFVEPNSPKLIPPLKKNQDYYNVYGNLWNHAYFSSAKVSQYYLNSLTPNSNNSPINLSSQTPSNRPYKSKSPKLSRDPSSISYTTGGNANNWQKLDSLPISKLQIVVPRKVLEKDSQGLKNIHEKSKELEKLENWKEKKKAEHRDEMRRMICERHEKIAKLESMAGVRKLRDESSCEVTTFGVATRYRSSGRIEALSRPKVRRSKDDLRHMDFRGIIHVDYPEAINKLSLKRKG